MALEEAAKKYFGRNVDVQKIVVEDVDVGMSSRASVYLTSKKHLYCYIHGPSKLLLGDVKKIVARMGLRAELYLPPKGRPTYFDDIGRDKFKEVYPSHRDPSSGQLVYYRTLAPYMPALVLVSEVKNGEIYCHDADSRSKWRVAAKFAYRRIRTS